VAKHHGVKAFINMSQMTLSQMSITETTASPQHKLHWLAEQALTSKMCSTPPAPSRALRVDPSFMTEPAIKTRGIGTTTRTTGNSGVNPFGFLPLGALISRLIRA
jgi:hypothetical protein